MFRKTKRQAISQTNETSSCNVPQRYIFGILGFMALSNAYIQRFSLSLTITEMAKPIHHPTVDKLECPGVIEIRNRTQGSHVYDWNEKTQGVILSSVFWGYVITQLPGGIISERYGGKHTLGFGMLLSIICNLITPFVVYYTGSIGLIAVRFFVGFGQGPLYPSLNVLLSHWAPFNERGRLGSIVFAGAQVGNVISMALTGVIIKQLNWQSVFYIYGILGLVWYVSWLLLVSERPSEHPFISENEKKYLSEMVIDVTDERKNLPRTPWSKILQSPAVWSLVIAQIGHDWGLFTIITDLPKYMKSVLHYSVAENGMTSALPYATMWMFAVISGIISDWMINSRGYNINIVRKLFITIAAVGPAIGLISASYAECDTFAVTIWFTVGIGLMGAFVPSLKVNPLDLSPNFAGSLMAMVGGIGAISGIFAPNLVGKLIVNGTLLEWRDVFWVAFYMLVVTTAIYLIFGSADVQPWNDPASLTSANEPQHKEIIGMTEMNGNADVSEEKNDQNGSEQPRRKSVFINNMPVDPTRRRSVFIERPLIA